MLKSQLYLGKIARTSLHRVFSTSFRAFNHAKTSTLELQAAQEQNVQPKAPKEYSLSADDIKQILKIPMDEFTDRVTDISPEIEQQLNEEFEQFVKEFGTEADLRSEVYKYVERTSKRGLNMDNLFSSKKYNNKSAANVDVDGNIRGRNEFPNVQPSSSNQSYTKQELFVRHLFHAQSSNSVGSVVQNVYKPHKDIAAPGSIREISIATLIAAGAHLGHSTALLRPSTQPYIYGVRDGIHIINLDMTVTHLRRAAKVVEGIAKNGGLILYVGTRNGQQRSLQMAANRSGGYYVHTRWVPGTLSNATEISGEWDKIEVNMADQETDRRKVSPNLKKTIVKPDLVVILNPVENRNAIRECISAKIPTVGIIDTDSEPSLVTYPIPANDDSLRTTDLIVGVLSRAGEKGRNHRYEEYKQYQQTKQQEAAKGSDSFNEYREASI